MRSRSFLRYLLPARWMFGISIIAVLLFAWLFTRNEVLVDEPVEWIAPADSLFPKGAPGELIDYGRELITHTALFLGPSGTVDSISNGMNCQNCHLEGGTKPFGNNYSAVAANYPKYRARSGSVESVERRINDCIQRSLDGRPLKNESKEMKAMVAYILWLGERVPKGKVPKGAGLVEPPYLSRAADPIGGQRIYETQCASCHGLDGAGKRNETKTEWEYPPLWGDQSFNTGAGLLRLTRAAGFIKANMPQGATFEKPILTDEEAWDVAAYITSMPRPNRTFDGDWPDMSQKPIDHPFGPFGDNFSADQHKFGPFQPIIDQRKGR